MFGEDFQRIFNVSFIRYTKKKKKRRKVKQKEELDFEEQKPVKMSRKKLTKKTEKKAEPEVDNHTRFKIMVLENLGAQRKELFEMAREAGIDLAEGSLSTIVYHVKGMLKTLAELGWEVPTIKTGARKK